jgi:hypothetical protein
LFPEPTPAISNIAVPKNSATRRWEILWFKMSSFWVFATLRKPIVRVCFAIVFDNEHAPISLEQRFVVLLIPLLRAFTSQRTSNIPTAEHFVCQIH